MKRESLRRLFWAGIFGITMGYFEASVVVYLRAIYYPEGFSFPLAVGRTDLLLVELGRELMSIGMILAVAALAGRNLFERFSIYCFIFGVWDILYYIFLKLTINWPPSLFTWDILFLIPVPWVGPVWAPVLCSLCFIISCILIVRCEDRGRPVRPSLLEWAMAISGGIIIILSFCEEYRIVIAGGEPESFCLPLFFLGIALGAAAFIRAYIRALGKEKT